MDSIVGTEYLPNTHIEKITISSRNDMLYDVEIIVACYDYEEKTWSADNKFTDYLSIFCYPEGNKQMINKADSGDTDFVARVNYYDEVQPFSNAVESIVQIGSKRYTRYKFSFKDRISKGKVDTSYYVASFIKMQELKQDENLNLSFVDNFRYVGSVKSERVLKDRAVPTESFVFRDFETGEIWSGPVHQHPVNGLYMEGSQHSSRPHRVLTRESVPNNKIEMLFPPIYSPFQILNPSLGAISPGLTSVLPSSTILPTDPFPTPSDSTAFSEPDGTLPSRFAAPGLTSALPRSTSLSQIPQSTAATQGPIARDVSYIAPGLSSQSPFATARIAGTAPLNLLTSAEQQYVHQMEFVEDYNRNVSNSLVVDVAGVALSESPAASIMYQYDKEAFTRITQATNIKNIEIDRYELLATRFSNRLGLSSYKIDLSKSNKIAMSHNNKQKIKNKTLFQVSPREIISVNPLTLGSNPNALFFNGKNLSLEMLKNAPKIGKVEQLELSLDSSLRAVSFTDYSIKNAKEGRYKYRVKILMEDQHLLYCKEMLKNLLMMESKIQNLYNVLTMKNVFEGDNFKIEFLEEFYSQYNVVVDIESGTIEGEFNTQELKDSYLIKSFEVLNQAERLIGVQQQSISMINNLNLFSTDLDKILNTSNYFKEIINLFKQTYNLSDGESYEKSSTSSRKEEGKIEKLLFLRNEYKRELLKPIGINYINMNSQTESMPIINLIDFNSRTNKEVSKFFNTSITTNSDSLSALPSNLRSNMANIEETKFMNFSPARVIFAGKEVDTTEINPESFNSDFFNNLRVASAALESEDDIRPENNIDEEQVEKYLDSREYLGDTTKFNNVILASLKLNPRKIPKVRKKYKFLDNSILKSKKRNISLKTFDLKQPDNYLSKKLMENPEAIPLQLKALSLLNTSMTNFDLNTIEFDPISNPQTQEVFMQNYLNIGKVQALMGFEKVNGRFMMDKPIYNEINTKTHEKLKNMNVLCRITPQSLDGFGVNHNNYNVHDKVFVMHSQEKPQIGEEDVES